MSKFGSPERVYVENEWYDGPRAGLADIGEIPHRFKSLFDEKEDEFTGTFMVWPVDKQVFDLEIEQWQIFVEWNALYESGKTNTDAHPVHGGLSARWDEIEILLQKSRSEVPALARRAVATFTRIEREVRYAESGPDYMLSWSIL